VAGISVIARLRRRPKVNALGKPRTRGQSPAGHQTSPWSARSI